MTLLKLSLIMDLMKNSKNQFMPKKLKEETEEQNLLTSTDSK